MNIHSKDQLRELYDAPSARAVKKELSRLDPHCKKFIQHSPFLVLSSMDVHQKMDNSPRGGKAGFVKILDDHQILIPDAKGNNRLDSMENILDTGRVGILFLIPGIDETLRVNGSAEISVSTEHISLFPGEQNPVKACILIHVEEAFLHCAKALMRSKLWDVNSQLKRSEFPTIGTMLKDQLGSSEDAETQEEMLKRYEKDL